MKLRAAIGITELPADVRPCFSRPGVRRRRFLIPACLFLTILVGQATGDGAAAQRVTVETFTVAQKDTSTKNRYKWLFRSPSDERDAPGKESTLLDTLDKQIKRARQLYLSGEADNAVLKYRSAIDYLESVVDDLPPQHPLLDEVSERSVIFEELASRILGPVEMEPKPETSGQVFHLMERRRIHLRNLALKKAGVTHFHDVSPSLADREAELLREYVALRHLPPSAINRRKEDEIKGRIAAVRKEIQRESPRYALLRTGPPPSLDLLRERVLAPGEMLIGFAVLNDRTVVGMIDKENARYFQIKAARQDLAEAVFDLQEKLREFASGSRSSFMGHAWKEPCRRIYRTLLGRLPPIPPDVRRILIIPDGALWYLPFNIILDPEDRPFGRDRVVSFIPSADILAFGRMRASAATESNSAGGLLVFESLPWIAEEDLAQSRTQSGGEDGKRQSSRTERIERLIVKNPVFPSPSEVIVRIQRLFKQFDACAGATATAERFKSYSGAQLDATVLAVPLSVTDTVSGEKQPCFFFSPQKRDGRKMPASELFGISLRSDIIMLPVAWFGDSPRGDRVGRGPLLLATAVYYMGTPLQMITYSNPGWGGDEPYLLELLTRIGKGMSPGRAVSETPRDMPSGLNTSFSGRPPSWAGWILIGDPYRIGAD